MRIKLKSTYTFSTITAKHFITDIVNNVSAVPVLSFKLKLLEDMSH